MLKIENSHETESKTDIEKFTQFVKTVLKDLSSDCTPLESSIDRYFEDRDRDLEKCIKTFDLKLFATYCGSYGTTSQRDSHSTAIENLTKGFESNDSKEYPISKENLTAEIDTKIDVDPRSDQEIQIDVDEELKFLNSKISFKLDSNYQFFNKIDSFIVDKYIDQHKEHADSKLKELQFIGSLPKNNSIEALYGLPPNCEVTIDFNGVDVSCVKNRLTPSHGTQGLILYLYELTLTTNDRKTIDDLITVACEYEVKNSVYFYNSKRGIWEVHGNTKKRPPNTLILDTNIKEKVLKDVKKFKNAKQRYLKFGVPYKRNYLFYGKPGTGKTSLVNLIAKITCRSLYVITFNNNTLEEDIYGAIRSINKNAILLLEDIDCVFQKREDSDAKNVKFSTLLNILDGAFSKRDLITIVTTNHIERLDNALIRPGRIDMVIKFSSMSASQIRELVQLYEIELNEDTLEKLVIKCKKKELAPAVLSAFMFKHDENELNNENFLKMFDKYLEEIKDTFVNEDYKNNYL